MQFELLVVGYMNRKYSAKRSEEVFQTAIRFMWFLQGELPPIHFSVY